MQTTAGGTPVAISVFIIAHDEADRIARAIDSVAGFADEVVVVDSGSTDGTQEIARAHGARVLENAWPGYGPQKRFGEDLSVRLTGSNLLDASKDEVFDKFDNGIDQANRDYDEFELETESAGPVYQLIARYSF